jgi:hypothetical protein
MPDSLEKEDVEEVLGVFATHGADFDVHSSRLLLFTYLTSPSTLSLLLPPPRGSRSGPER